MFAAIFGRGKKKPVAESPSNKLHTVLQGRVSKTSQSPTDKLPTFPPPSALSPSDDAPRPSKRRCTPLSMTPPARPVDKPATPTSLKYEEDDSSEPIRQSIEMDDLIVEDGAAILLRKEDVDMNSEEDVDTNSSDTSKEDDMDLESEVKDALQREPAENEDDSLEDAMELSESGSCESSVGNVDEGSEYQTEDDVDDGANWPDQSHFVNTAVDGLRSKPKLDAHCPDTGEVVETQDNATTLRRPFLNVFAPSAFTLDPTPEGEEVEEEFMPEDDEEEESEWALDPEDMAAYEEAKQGLHGHDTWLRGERELHKLLSLRGMHPLMPHTWARDFLGVPMHPSLFAPLASERHPVIHHKTSQFRATKALRSIFELQSRVSGLRQVGLPGKIGWIIQKELESYVKWAMNDAGLDCYQYMPNISIQRFSPTKTDGVTLAKQMREHFQRWTNSYREFYGKIPGVKPPRLLYGVVVIQHAVLLFTVDSARQKVRPKCFADFNMSRGDMWLDTSLNVTIPILLAREDLLKIAKGLPKKEAGGESDVDA